MIALEALVATHNAIVALSTAYAKAIDAREAEHRAEIAALNMRVAELAAQFAALQAAAGPAGPS